MPSLLPHRKHTAIWGAIALILIFLSVRLWAITTFPPFLDEAYHEQCVEKAIRTGPLICAPDARLFTVWWYVPFQPQANAAIWIMRVATLLALLPGYAAALAIGRMLTGRTGMILVGLVLIFSTYHQFFDRLAIGDTIAAWVLMVALYFGCRLTRRNRLTDAMLMGAVVFVAIGFKLSVLPYLGLPLAAGLTLWQRGVGWRQGLRQNVRWIVAAMGTAIGLLATFTIILRLFGYNALGLISVHNSNASAPLTTRLIDHARATGELVVAYASPVGAVLLLLAVVYLLIRRQFYLLLALLGPLVALWINNTYFTRYFSPPILILFICGAVALADFVRKANFSIQTMAIMLVLIFGSAYWAPFAWTMTQNPITLELAAADRAEYISSDASGFGLAQLQSKLKQVEAKEVIGLFSSCVNLQLMAKDELTVICPTLNPSGINLPELTALLDSNQREGVFAILENIPYVPQSAPGQAISTLERPFGGTKLTLYELAPNVTP